MKRLALLLPLFALAAAPARAADPATSTDNWIRTETRLEPGATRIDLRRESPPCDVRMVAFDRAALPGLRFHVREAGGGLFATRAVPALAKSRTTRARSSASARGRSSSSSRTRGPPVRAA